MSDRFGESSENVSAPARRTVAVVPHDVNALGMVAKSLYVGTTGNVTLRAVDDVEDVVFANVQAGSYILVRAEYVRATGTTASDIVALV